MLALATACAITVHAASAGASQLIDRNASNVRLSVSSNGVALLTYTAGGKQRRVLARDAINARQPSHARPQVKFKLDYAGGWRFSRRPSWRMLENACRPYDGPALAWLVAACKAADGSYWAVQSWQRMLPNLGRAPSPSEAAWELRLSHWRGALAVLKIELDWAYRRYDHLFGSLSYLGRPVHGFRATRQGAPLDTYGRNIYVDTLNSAYGRGWRREMSFLAHRPRGNFCYGFFPRGGRPSGKGDAYRATVIGPGVTPDVFWQATSPGPYDESRDRSRNAEQLALAGGGKLCRPN